MIITQEQLMDLVEEPFFSRGIAYLQEGMVAFFEIEQEYVQAQVMDHKAHFVNLNLVDGELEGDCSCMALHLYGPCKHIAAAGLALIAHNGVGYRPSERYAEMMRFFTTLREALMERDKESLVALLVTLINDDPSKLLCLGADQAEELLGEHDFWV